MLADSPKLSLAGRLSRSSRQTVPQAVSVDNGLSSLGPALTTRVAQVSVGPSVRPSVTSMKGDDRRRATSEAHCSRRRRRTPASIHYSREINSTTDGANAEDYDHCVTIHTLPSICQGDNSYPTGGGGGWRRCILCYCHRKR